LQSVATSAPVPNSRDLNTDHKPTFAGAEAAPEDPQRSWDILGIILGCQENYGDVMHFSWQKSYLVGGFNPSEKYWSVGIIVPNMCKNKTCSKPPTSSPIVP